MALAQRVPREPSERQKRWDEAVSELVDRFGTLKVTQRVALEQLYLKCKLLYVPSLAHRPGTESAWTDASWKAAASIVSPLVKALETETLASFLRAGKDRKERVILFIELCRRIRGALHSLRAASPATRAALAALCHHVLGGKLRDESHAPTSSVFVTGFTLCLDFMQHCARKEFDRAANSVRPFFVQAFSGTKCAGAESEDPVCLLSEFREAPVRRLLPDPPADVPVSPVEAPETAAKTKKRMGVQMRAPTRRAASAVTPAAESAAIQAAKRPASAAKRSASAVTPAAESAAIQAAKRPASAAKRSASAAKRSASAALPAAERAAPPATTPSAAAPALVPFDPKNVPRFIRIIVVADK